jgi:type II secretory pathway pseudopilin PulG
MDISRTTSTTGKTSGVSFIELIIVIAVIGTALAGVSVHYTHRVSKVRLDTAASELATTLRWARRLAITTRKLHRVAFSSGEGIYWIEDAQGTRVDRQYRLGRGIAFSHPTSSPAPEEGLIEGGSPDGAISFFPQGTSEGASVYLVDERRQVWRTLTIVPTTGMVRLYNQKRTSAH